MERGRDQTVVSITHSTNTRDVIRMKIHLPSWELMQETRPGYVLAQSPARRDPKHHDTICGSGPDDFHRRVTAPFFPDA